MAHPPLGSGPSEETTAQFSTRLKVIAQEINDSLDVDGLCRALPKRVQGVIDVEGDRLMH